MPMRHRCLLAILSAALCLSAAPQLRAQTLPETVLFSFSGANGDDPGAAPIQASDGNFYGVTLFGGTNTNSGTVYRITPAGAETVIYSFCAQANCDDGTEPYRLIEGTDGNLYGVCLSGGSANYGTIFRMSLTGTNYTVLHTFTSDAPFYGDAVGIVEGSDGNFYGGLASGSVKGGVYKLTPAGTYSVLYGNDTAGTMEAYTDLTEASDGFLYGTSVAGGANSAGFIFRVSFAGVFSDVYDFCSVKNCADGNAGGVANSNLVEGSDAALYATTYEGGIPMDASPYGEGVLYRFVPSTFGQTVLYTFCAKDALCSDGARPETTLFLGGEGSLYGNNSATPYVANSEGNLYSQTLTGTHTILYNYSSTQNTQAGPVEGGDGYLYDPISYGGSSADGEFARFAPAGTTPPISISVSPDSIVAGQSATLTWKVNNAFSNTMESCFASGGWSGLQAISGTLTVKPAASTSYALTCGGIETGIAAISVVVPKDTTMTALKISPNPIAPGATTTLTATVTRVPVGGTPTGTVSFVYSTQTLATVTLNGSGVATLSASTGTLPLGNYPITAQYNGDANDDTSSGSATAMIRNPTTTTLTAAPNPVTPPASVTLTATVKRSKTTGTPAGSVNFLYAGQSIGSGTLNPSGVATLTAATGSLPAGSYSVTAAYVGNGTDAVSTSAAVVVTLQ